MRAVDLPGFGSNADARGGGELDAMTDAAMEAVRRLPSGPWFLLGHSMGGKVAVAVAAALRDDPATAAVPSGIILLAPSPSSPEPMPDEKRNEMLGWAQNDITVAEAEQFLHDDCARPLAAREHDIAIRTITESASSAWANWLTTGSREDLTGVVGRLDLPAIVLGGDADTALGDDAQRELQCATLPIAQYVRLSDTGHQIPLERPRDTARIIHTFMRQNASSTHDA